MNVYDHQFSALTLSGQRELRNKEHPGPEKLIQRIIMEAHKGFKEGLKSESKEPGEFTVVGKSSESKMKLAQIPLT